MIDEQIWLKIHANPDLNRLDSNLILGIINELTMIQNNMTEGKLFSVGTIIGRLQGDLVILYEQLNEKEKKKHYGEGKMPC